MEVMTGVSIEYADYQLAFIKRQSLSERNFLDIHGLAAIVIGFSTDEISRSMCKLHDEEGHLVQALDGQWAVNKPFGSLSPLPGSVVELVEIARGTKMLEPYKEISSRLF